MLLNDEAISGPGQAVAVNARVSIGRLWMFQLVGSLSAETDCRRQVGSVSGVELAGGASFYHEIRI